MTRLLGALPLVGALLALPVALACSPLDYSVRQSFSADLTPTGGHVLLAASRAAVDHADYGLSFQVTGPGAVGLVADDPTLDELIAPAGDRLDLSAEELRRRCVDQEICSIGLTVMPSVAGTYSFDYRLSAASTFPATAAVTAELD